MTQDEIQTAILQVCKVSGNDSDFNVVRFYTLCDRLVELGAAAEREWQGLTDEEVDNFAKAVWPREATSSDFIRAIEAKLKEKNA